MLIRMQQRKQEKYDKKIWSEDPQYRFSDKESCLRSVFVLFSGQASGRIAFLLPNLIFFRDLDVLSITACRFGRGEVFPSLASYIRDLLVAFQQQILRRLPGAIGIC